MYTISLFSGHTIVLIISFSPVNAIVLQRLHLQAFLTSQGRGSHRTEFDFLLVCRRILLAAFGYANSVVTDYQQMKSQKVYRIFNLFDIIPEEIMHNTMEELSERNQNKIRNLPISLPDGGN